MIGAGRKQQASSFSSGTSFANNIFHCIGGRCQIQGKSIGDLRHEAGSRVEGNIEAYTVGCNRRWVVRRPLDQAGSPHTCFELFISSTAKVRCGDDSCFNVEQRRELSVQIVQNPFHVLGTMHLFTCFVHVHMSEIIVCLNDCGRSIDQTTCTWLWSLISVYFDLTFPSIVSEKQSISTNHAISQFFFCNTTWLQDTSSSRVILDYTSHGNQTRPVTPKIHRQSQLYCHLHRHQNTSSCGQGHTTFLS
jgi:hypothetical protein